MLAGLVTLWLAPTALRADPAPAAAVTRAHEAIVPPALLPERPWHFVVGVVFERGAHDLGRQRMLADQLLGLSMALRVQRLGVDLRLMISPNLDEERIENIRGQAALGLRGHFALRGLDFSAGGGFHMEARLRNHYWLAYLTPLELGATIYDRGAWRVGLFLGVRRLVAGRLINLFVVDPNGFENEIAEDGLRDLRDQPWEAFARLVFGRRLD